MPARRKVDDDALLERLLDALRSGNYRGPACAAAGVDPSTLRAWLRRGRADLAEGVTDSREAVILQRVAEAEAVAEVGAVEALRAGFDDWRAALAFLQARHPDRWARGRAPEAPEGAPIDRRKVLEDPEAARMAEDLLARVAAERPDTGGLA